MKTEFFILGEDFGLYEQLVAAEEFTPEEIHAVKIREQAPGYAWSSRISLIGRRITLQDLDAAFSPHLIRANRVVSCDEASSPDYEMADVFALVPRGTGSRSHSGLYGMLQDDFIQCLYGSGLRPLTKLSGVLAQPLADFCRRFALLLVLHSDFVLDVRDPTQLVLPENEQYA